MQTLTRIIIFSRHFLLKREMSKVRNALTRLSPKRVHLLAGITARELQRAGEYEHPHLYATSSDHRYRLWGAGTSTGMDWCRSENPQLIVRGIALWLAVAYHETRYSKSARLQKLHTAVQKLLLDISKIGQEEEKQAA